MRLKFVSPVPGIVAGEPTWHPGEEREVASHLAAPRLQSPLWAKAAAKPTIAPLSTKPRRAQEA